MVGPRWVNLPHSYVTLADFAYFLFKVYFRLTTSPSLYLYIHLILSMEHNSCFTDKILHWLLLSVIKYCLYNSCFIK
jgi:hypothetical protein